MTAADEAQRRVEKVRESVGFSDEQATWWATGFAAGAEWQASRSPAAETDGPLG